MKLILVRHGESVANVNPKLYDSIPDHAIPLSDEGKLQAKFTGGLISRYLKSQICNIPVEHLIYSPYNRTKETTEIIYDNLNGIGINSFVEYVGIHEIEIYNNHPDMRESNCYNIDEMEEYGKFWFKRGTAESLADVYKRAKQFLRDLIDLNLPQGTPVIVVSHRVFLRVLTSILEGHTIKKLCKSGINFNNAEARVYDLDTQNSKFGVPEILGIKKLNENKELSYVENCTFN